MATDVFYLTHSSLRNLISGCPTDNKARAMCRSEDCLKGLKLVRFTKIPCDQFLTMGLRYQHTDPPSPDKDYITIKLELKDVRSGSIYRVARLHQLHVSSEITNLSH